MSMQTTVRSDVDVLLNLNREYIEAVKRSDAAWFRQVLTDDFRCSLVGTGVYHALFVAVNFGALVAATTDARTSAATLALALPEQYARLALRILVIPPAVVFTLLSGAAILSGRTRYPRWFVLVSPFVLLAVYALLTALLGPSSVLSFALLGNAYNLSALLFFIVSTFTLWTCDGAKENGGLA